MKKKMIFITAATLLSMSVFALAQAADGTGLLTFRGELASGFDRPRRCQVTEIANPNGGEPSTRIAFLNDRGEVFESILFSGGNKVKVESSGDKMIYESRIQKRPTPGTRNVMICGEWGPTFHPKDMLTVSPDTVTIRKVYRCPILVLPLSLFYWEHADYVATCHVE